MPGNARIVCYGADDRLLETRCWVLESAGFSVSPVTSDLAFRDSLRSGPCELILLCHSLSREQVEDALQTIKSEGISQPVLKLNAGTGGTTDYGVELVLDAMDGPRAVLAAVERLLARQ